MKLLRCGAIVALLILAQPVAVDAAEAERTDPERLLAEVDVKVLVEQYRDLRMATFDLRKDVLLLELIEERDAADNGARAKLEVKRAQLERLEQWTREIRQQLEALSRQPAPRPEAAGTSARFQGTWIGHEPNSDRRVRLTVNADRAELRLVGNDEWYKGRLEFEPQNDRGDLWRVRFHVEACPEPKYVGKTALGLARVRGDRFVLAANEPGIAQWPASTESSGDTRAFVFERE